MSYEPDAIRALRHSLGLSQRDLAEKIGVTPSNISRWEAGRTRPRGPAVKLLAGLERRANRNPQRGQQPEAAA